MSAAHKVAAFVGFESRARRRIRVHHVLERERRIKKLAAIGAVDVVGWQHVPAMQALGQ